MTKFNIYRKEKKIHLMLGIDVNVLRRYDGSEKQGGEYDCVMIRSLAMCVGLVCVCVQCILYMCLCRCMLGVCRSSYLECVLYLSSQEITSFSGCGR